MVAILITPVIKGRIPKERSDGLTNKLEAFLTFGLKYVWIILGNGIMNFVGSCMRNMFTEASEILKGNNSQDEQR